LRLRAITGAKDARNRRIFELWMACHTQEEIGKELGCDQKTVANHVSGISADLPEFLKSTPAADHLTDFTPPVYRAQTQAEVSQRTT
jgi:hypothetical protein